MSDPENFLTRWSRRKQEAERERPASAPPDDKGEPESAAAAPDAAETEGAELDLSKLPSLDSITAGTDMRVFLQKGVPAELTRAALRRAWTSDPAIRDFIEVAENQWDFATGSDIPGFGPLESTEEVRRMVESMFEAPPEPAPEEQLAKTQNAGDSPPETQGSAPASDPKAPLPAATSETIDAMTAPREENTALQQSSEDPAPTLPTRKRHGSALPE